MGEPAVEKGEKIYIAGPYSGPNEATRLENTIRAIVMGIRVMEKGHFPFIPHLTHYADRIARDFLGIDYGYAHWMRQDEVFLEQCDSLFLFDRSPGADVEVRRATEQKKCIYYKLSDIPEVIPF